MSPDEAKNLKLGDYVKRIVAGHSDEYYMVTGITKNFKLRRVGNKELIQTTDLNEYTKIETHN